MAARLATVPEESTNGFMAASQPPRSPYRDLIRMVAVSGEQIRSTIFSNSQSSHDGSSYSSDSGTSNSYPSNNSGGFSGSASAALPDPDLGFFHELTIIAFQMVNDGYTERMVQAYNAASPPTAAFEYGGGQDRAALGNWFSELDVDWVLQLREGYGLQHVVQFPDRLLPDLVEKWIRGLTVIVVSIMKLAFVGHGTPEVARFGKASIAEMLVFTDAIVPALKARNLQDVLDMYICVSNASSYMSLPFEIGSLFMPSEIGSPLARAGTRLNNAISSTMEKVRTLMEDDDLWAIEIPRGGGEVHTNTRFMVDCIVSIRRTRASTENFAPSDHTRNLYGLISVAIKYQMDLLLIKSMLCSDPSLRYLFLLNNFNFIANVLEQWRSDHDPWLERLRLKRECEKHMDRYIDLSWGHVISYIPTSVFSRPLIHRWSNTSLLANFESAFHETYQAHKFWKVPEPCLRNLLRESIAKRVISVYRDCLEENLELQKHVDAGTSSSPDVLEEMLRELFEG